MAGSFLLWGCLSLVLVPAEEILDECLEDAIPLASRTNTVDMLGTRMPLGIVHYAWTSAQIATDIFKILVSEKLGYQVAPAEDGEGLSTSIMGFYSVAGCENPSSEEPQCGSAESHAHVAVEAWVGSYAATIDTFIQRFPDVAPLRAGSVGYQGLETLYVLDASRNQAWEQEGLALEYFKSYNATWTQPWQYFAQPHDLAEPQTRLMKCEDVIEWQWESSIRAFLEVTGDTDGVENDAGGNVRYKCWDDHWWYSPACRTNTSRCIFTYTGGTGWHINSYMQKAVVNDMPIAIANAATWADYTAIAREYPTLFHWWQPDTLFLDLRPLEVIFPANDRNCWTEGDHRSMAADVPLVKFGWHGLDTGAPDVYHLLEALEYSQSTATHLLHDLVASGDSTRSVACRWLRANRAVWQEWLPEPTDCIAGQGLINLTDDFVTQRSDATGCSWCGQGRYSKEIRSATYICEICAPGTLQAVPGATECDLCGAGSYTDAAGQSECKRCAVGRYQASANQSSCLGCVAPRTTMVLGALDPGECVCPADMYMTLTGDCQDCPVGMSCVEGSDEANMPSSAADVPSEAAYPRIDRGYYSEYASPLVVYRCRDEAACPGVDPEMCSENMEGIACGRCKPGQYRMGEGCMPCGHVEKSRVLFPILPIVLGPVVVFGMHRVSQDPVDKWGSPANSLQAAWYVVLVYLQMLASIGKMYISTPTIYTSGTGWSSTTYDLMSSLRPECAVLDDFTISFTVKLFVPAYAAAIFLMTYGTSTVLEHWIPALHLDRDIVFNNFMGIFYTFFVGIAAQTISLWQCYEHPNGKSSLMSAPDVICYEETWTSLVTVSVIAALIFCAGALMVFSWAIIVAPQRFREESFRKRWKFLFIKFRPDTYWWGILLLARGLWVPMTTVAFDVGTRQIIWLSSMIVVYQVGCFAFLPWRSFSVAILDVVVHTSLGSLLAMMPYFAAPGEVTSKELASCALSIAGVPPCCGGLIFLYLGSKVLSRSCGTSSTATGNDVSDMCKVFSDLKDPDELLKVWRLLPTADRKLLLNARNLIASEVFHVYVPGRLAPRQKPVGAGIFSKWPSIRDTLAPPQPTARHLGSLSAEVVGWNEEIHKVGVAPPPAIVPPQPHVDEPPATREVISAEERFLHPETRFARDGSDSALRWI